MIWYLVICGLNVSSSSCTFSPPFKSVEQCNFVRNSFYAIEQRIAKCIGVKK